MIDLYIYLFDHFIDNRHDELTIAVSFFSNKFNRMVILFMMQIKLLLFFFY